MKMKKRQRNALLPAFSLETSKGKRKGFSAAFIKGLFREMPVLVCLLIQNIPVKNLFFL